MSKEKDIDQTPKSSGTPDDVNEIVFHERALEQPITQSENMEVHHHAHHEGKKNWKSYFWEFLMLFLAVFCGFLAENQREHIVEHQREKEYMKSMLEDLKHDTSEFQYNIGEINHYYITVLNISSLLLFSEDFSDSTIRAMYDTVPKAIRYFSITLQ